VATRAYWLSVPERLVRATLGLGAGVTREVAAVGLPAGVRHSQLYRNLVDTTLRFLIEQVGGAEGVYKADADLPADFLTRRAAGNAVEVLGLVAFRASPVWVLAALADLAGIGRVLIPEVADALKAQGLLEKNAEFHSVDQVLDGLERSSARLASTINTPPLDVAGLRQEWNAIRSEVGHLGAASLPSKDTIGRIWSDLKTEASRQHRSIFETSSMLAVSAVRGLPEQAHWLLASARVGATKTGQVFATALLDHYKTTLHEIREVGYVTYAGRQLGPYLRAAVGQFSPRRQSLTERVADAIQSHRDRRAARKAPGRGR
jgi:hypothetical protein